MPAGMQMTFLDDNTLLFGDSGALRGALDARDGYSYSLDSNTDITDMMGSVDSGTVWSVLDQQGTQNMLHSALGDAAGLADYDTVKKRILGSRYTMNFESGVNFDLDVVTSDSMTATTLSSLLKAGMLYKKMSATPTEKVALDNVSVNSDSSNLQMHFKADDKQFQGCCTHRCLRRYRNSPPQFSVILSEVSASQSEAVAQSKDPYRLGNAVVSWDLGSTGLGRAGSLLWGCRTSGRSRLHFTGG